MQKNIFSLLPNSHGSIHEIPVPEEFHIHVGHCIVQVKKGGSVVQGERLAELPLAGGGRLHAPVAGKVSKLDQLYLTLTPAAENTPVDAKEGFSSMMPKELVHTLRDMGIDIGRLELASTLIVNGLNTEPGLQVASTLLKNCQEALLQGLSLVRRIVQPKDVVQVLPEGEAVALPGVRVVGIKPVYPNALSPLVAKVVMGKESPKDVVGINVDDLYDIGCIALSGLPVTETLMTIGSDTYRVKIGTPVRFILDHLGIAVHERDRVILGGSMRGRTLYSLDQGVEKGDRGLFVIPFASYPPVHNGPCIGCGACVRHCPARLRPDMITRYAEFRLYEKTREYCIDQCFECGLCTFYCPVHRPMLQYIRLAKEECLFRKTIPAKKTHAG